MTPNLLYKVLQIALRGSHNLQPTPWRSIIGELQAACMPSIDNKDETCIQAFMNMMDGLKNPDQLSSFMTDDCQKVIAVINPEDPPDASFKLVRRSWLGIYLRRCHLAFHKLSEAALYRLSKAYCAWVEDNGDLYEFSLDTVEAPGYLLITTSVDERSHGHTDPFRRFEYDKHVGNTAGAVENLRQYFDQQFTGGRQPPRQHALNALAQYHFTAGEIESARMMGGEAVDVARTVSDRQTLTNVSSMMRRLPPRPPPRFLNDPLQRHLKKVLLDREDAVGGKSNTEVYGQYSLVQVGVSPLDLLYDVSKGIDVGEPLSFLFRKRFEATGCIDLPQDFPGASLETQWQIWAIDSQLWRMAGLSKVAEIGDSVVLQNTSPGEDIRLYTICNKARQLFQKGEYLEAFATLLSKEVWMQLSLGQYQYWSSEVWHLMWDIATRRGQGRFKREYLESRRPGPSPVTKRDYGKKSCASIRRLILDAAEAFRVKDYMHATFLILDALHYAETNGYWYLYRSAVPIFADLELQRGKIESARRMIDEILPQVARGEDLEQRALTYAVYAKVKMASDRLRSAESLSDALYYLKQAEHDYEALEMHHSVQDIVYLQTIVFEAIGDAELRDEGSRKVMEEEETIKRLQAEMDDGMMAIWDIVCEIGVAVASGDTYWEQ